MTRYFRRDDLRPATLAVVVLLGAATGMAAVPAGALEPAPDSGLRFDTDGAQQPVAGERPAVNPLWAISLKALSATRERPIFSPSRRAATPVATAPYVPPPSLKPKEPDRPQLSLVGTIAGDSGGFGIFVDRAANTVLRLRIGEEHRGWVLRAVRGRDVVLEKDDRTTTLSLPLPSDPAAVAQDEVDDEEERPRRPAR